MSFMLVCIIIAVDCRKLITYSKLYIDYRVIIIFNNYILHFYTHIDLNWQYLITAAGWLRESL